MGVEWLYCGTRLEHDASHKARLLSRKHVPRESIWADVAHSAELGVTLSVVEAVEVVFSLSCEILLCFWSLQFKIFLVFLGPPKIFSSFVFPEPGG